MTAENFCLQWNGFEKNIHTAFRELREDKNMFDVTLVCDDEQIQAHKIILSACSPFFRKVLRRNPHPHPLVYLKGVKFRSLQSVLDFMYHGKVYVTLEELQPFLIVAEDLHVLEQTKEHSSDSNNRPTPNKSLSKPSLSKLATVTDMLSPSETPQPSSNNLDNNEEVVSYFKEEPQTYQHGPEVNDNIVEQNYVEQYRGDEGQENCGECVGQEPRYEAGPMEMDHTMLWSADHDEVRMEEMGQNLNNHVEKHMEPLRYQCKFCLSELKNKNSLKNHVSVYHREERKNQQ